MIVCNSRNRHNVHIHLTNMLLSERAEADAALGSVRMRHPVLVNLSRPDEIVDLLPGLTIPPGAVMRGMIEGAAQLTHTANLSEPLIASLRVESNPWASMTFGISHNDTLTACASVQSMDLSGCACSLPYDPAGSIMATVGFMQAVLAEQYSLGIGHATFYVNNLTATKDGIDTAKALAQSAHRENNVYHDTLRPGPMFDDGTLMRTFWEDCNLLLRDNVTYGLRSRWLRRVAVPVLKACEHIDKTGNVAEAHEINAQCDAPDWQLVVTSYIEGHALRASKK